MIRKRFPCMLVATSGIWGLTISPTCRNYNRWNSNCECCTRQRKCQNEYNFLHNNLLLLGITHNARSGPSITGNRAFATFSNFGNQIDRFNRRKFWYLPFSSATAPAGPAAMIAPDPMACIKPKKKFFFALPYATPKNT